MAQSEPMRWKRNFAEPSGKKPTFSYWTLCMRRYKVRGLFSHIIRGTGTTVEEGSTERDGKAILVILLWPQIKTCQKLEQSLAFSTVWANEASLCLHQFGLHLMSFFIYMWLKDLDMLILKRKRPKKNTNGFQIFEGCWVEELLEYSVCLQGVKLGSVGRCFRWSDFRAI